MAFPFYWNHEKSNIFYLNHEKSNMTLIFLILDEQKIKSKFADGRTKCELIVESTK
jgi:hypothetical protein